MPITFNKIQRMYDLINLLNQYRDSYYNKQISIISDFEYDNLFDELKRIENETGVIMSNSPTVTVGYEVKSELDKVKHNHPMLSLDKTKSITDLMNFAKSYHTIMMLKMDGLTVSLRYVNGELISAETRGDGEIGEDILHNVKVFTNIPLTIKYKEELIVDGEAIIDYDTFEVINSSLPDKEKFKNPRNLVSGSVRQLDSKIAAQRNIKFIAWKCIKGFVYETEFDEKLIDLSELGFDIVPYLAFGDFGYNPKTKDEWEEMIHILKDQAVCFKYPIDGMVLGYNDISYSDSLGMTSHHLRSQLAFKFYDEETEAILKDVEWTLGKTGLITPTAVFEPVEIDGSTVERASLHNLSIMEDLWNQEWYSGLIVSVYKANAIIPQISSVQNNNEKGNFKIIKPPAYCPVCGGATQITKENNTKVLRCTNINCKGLLLKKLVHFVSKEAMNIDGLSEASLKKFIDEGFIESFIDIYELKSFYNDIVALDGFGKKSTDKLMNAIENSKTVTLNRFINALSIPNVGKTASKTIDKYFNGNFDLFYKAFCGNPTFGSFDWTQLDDFGYVINDSINSYAEINADLVLELSRYMNFIVSRSNKKDLILQDKIFVITGSLKQFNNRNEAIKQIENLGGKVSGSVSKNTTYLVNNDINSNSSKNKKAKELNIPIINEDELINMFKNI